MTEYPAAFGAYPPRLRLARPIWAAATLVSRSCDLLRSAGHDVSLLQREFVSTRYTLEPLTKKPRVLDVDDAIWLHGNGAARSLARACDAVICGNSFVAEYFRKWNHRIRLLPTAVDTEWYRPDRLSPATGTQIIGWSGLSSGFCYLYRIERALAVVLRRFPEAKLRVVSDRRPRFSAIPEARVDFVRWTLRSELPALQGMQFGIMPLDDSPWARGKCSYKMLLYMACEKPVVVSPVGMNREVLALGNVGYGPDAEADWVDCLSALLESPERCALLGRAARSLVVGNFSTRRLAAKLAHILTEVGSVAGA